MEILSSYVSLRANEILKYDNELRLHKGISENECAWCVPLKNV